MHDWLEVPAMRPPPAAPTRRSAFVPRREFAWLQDGPALLGLLLLSAYFVALSWRKWPDPLIDFGRELYTAWRLANGAVLYRDVDAIYGPLSQLLNAALFRVFGPGLMVLVTANLLVFAASLVLLYELFRRAWGTVAALVAGAIFVAVFGFSQLAVVGNYNFATPYAHEVTHGFLTCLLLVAVLGRWVEAGTPRLGMLAGALFGVTVVIKPEFMLAGGLVTLAAGGLRWRGSGRPGVRCLGAWLAGALLPTLLVTGWFLQDLPASEAVEAASRGWLNVLGSSTFTSSTLQATFLGLDRPWTHFVEHLRATAVALVLVAALAGAAWAARRPAGGWAGRGAWVAVVAALAWIASSQVSWMLAGRCLFGLVALYALVRVVASCSAAGTRDDSGAGSMRLLLAVLAGAFMARMVLNGRFGQYGFWQAAIASCLVPAVLLGELPSWIRVDDRGRAIVLAGTLALVGPGVATLVAQSRQLLQAKTYAVGDAGDLFYAFPSAMLPTAELVQLFTKELRKQPEGDTLLVLPEGVMLNYLARLPSPVAPFFFFYYVTADGREAELVRQLEARPPTWVAVVSRDLREYGIERYGESVGHGQLLMKWVEQHYEPVGHLGGDPLDVRQFGGLVLHRRPAPGK